MIQDIKILVVDDEDKMRNVINIFLKNEGYTVEEACDGREALDKLSNMEFSLVILDIMMPKVDGWEVCKEIRKSSLIPIIMLTARGEEYDKLLGFELGVDDYVTKPFSPKELTARVKALIKRTYNEDNKNSTNFLKIGDLSINILGKQGFIQEKQLILTPKEYDLLYFLAKHPEQVFSRDQLLDKVWGYDFFGDYRTVDTHVKQLREKLGKDKKYIHTVWGVGYKFKVGD